MCRLTGLLVTAAVLATAACTPVQATTTVTVLAAASLRESLDELARIYESRDSRMRVVISYGPSSTLARQVADGAPVDVLVTADTVSMDVARASGRVEESTVVARNTLTVAVAPGSQSRIQRPADLAAPQARVAVCAAEVPCGRLAGVWQRSSGTTLHPLTREADVKAVLTKVRAREVDAGLVYRSDVLAAAGDGVTEISLPDAPTTDYPAAALTDAGRGFVDLLRSADGRAVLTRHGLA